jgi:subtilisin family serine protease
MKRPIRTVATLFIFIAAANIPSSRITAQVQGPESAQVRGSSGSAARSSGLYIVQMADLPVASYLGEIAGLARTKPGPGQKIDPLGPDVLNYVAYLDASHDDALARAGGGRKVYGYRYSFNGFAAQLTEQQAEALRSTPGVLNVTRDELVDANTSSTPHFLGLDAEGGAWDQAGGVGDAGEDIIVGIIDSGIWPENASFSDRVDGKRLYQQVPGWHGKCTPGEQFPASKCNQKLIGAQRFNAAWGGDAALKAERPWEFASPRDYNGHGSHTAGTAAGNHAVALEGDAVIFGTASGMAPRARIAVYKALWSTRDASQASGFTSDLVAAIDQAVADGVDVINYSISGTSTNFLDPAEVAFLFAADAGVFVAASGGNDGPGASTVAHPSPWVTTVAASTHNRNGEGSVTLGNGATYTGASLANAVPSRPLINANEARKTGADATKAAQCYPAADNTGQAVLDPAKVAGRIVVCERGVIGRVSKSLAVLEAGGVGMILVNTSDSSINADFHFVPTVHLSHLDKDAVQAYASGASATATINKAEVVYDAPAPETAAFSSRGPLRAGGGDVLKPDITAPGVDILAAVAPPGNGGRTFNIYSGTSMSSPHVAGLAALLMDQHPDWTPMMIKSALMTTAYNVIDPGISETTRIFRQGAGHARPNTAVEPGLVYDSNINHWLAFLCGSTTGVNPATCSALKGAGFSFDASDMNVPSIAIGDLAGVQTVRRTVTNVGASQATYTPAVSGMDGFDVVVSPSSLTIDPGQRKSFTVAFTRTTATLNAYTGGQLMLTDGSHDVRIPLVVRPLALAAPAEVSGTGGPIEFSVTFGYDGPFGAAARGLIPAEQVTGTVGDDPADSFSPTGQGVTAFNMVIPAGTTYARFSLFDANVSPASDLDLYVYSGTTLVRISGTETSNEEANFVFAAPTSAAIPLTVYVHGYDVPGTANFTLFSWMLGTADAGNMSVTAPPTATTGGSGTVGLTFSGLAPATRYLGSVVYSGTAGMPNPTIVRVDTP